MKNGKIRPEEQLVPALYVLDLEKSCDFYRRLGFEEVRRDGIFVELQWHGSPLFLVEMATQAPPFPIGNLRVLVPDVDAHWKRITEMGMEIVSPLQDRPYGLREFTVAGPDGFHIRFASFISDGDR